MQSENGIVASSIGKDCVIRKIKSTHIPEKDKFYLEKYNLLCRGTLWEKIKALLLITHSSHPYKDFIFLLTLKAAFFASEMSRWSQAFHQNGFYQEYSGQHTTVKPSASTKQHLSSCNKTL